MYYYVVAVFHYRIGAKFMNNSEDTNLMVENELNRIKDIASKLNPLTGNPQVVSSNNHPTWPWQVPQAPVYTAGNSGKNPIKR